MFNLDRAIVDWRRQMTDGGIKSTVVLDELESHLRDDVEQQMRSGVDGRRAFVGAVQRIGEANALKAEFVKAGGTKEARLGKLIGIALVVVAGLFSLAMLASLLAFRGASFAERLLGLAAVAFTMSSIPSWRYSHRLLPVIRDKGVRTAVEIACGLSGGVWMPLFMNLILPRFIDLPAGGYGQMMVVYLWASTLMAVLGGVAYGLEEAARKQTATANS